jgi:hypothetical protein
LSINNLFIFRDYFGIADDEKDLEDILFGTDKVDLNQINELGIMFLSLFSLVNIK